MVAPIGVQSMVHEDAEIGTARAAAKVGVPFIMSSAATRSLEAVAKASGTGHRWYQLYWFVHLPRCPSLEALNRLLLAAGPNQMI